MSDTSPATGPEELFDQTTNASSRRFTWLHLTDLHVGMSNQDWLWPTLKTSLFEDLKKTHHLSGGWDLVIFSGDLVQSGASAEYNRLNTILTELWDFFAKLNCYPGLFVLPGNHDLKRPTLNSAFRTLKRWWNETEVQQEFFRDRDNEYRKAVATIFEQYSIWLSDATTETKFGLKPGLVGLLPGDQSAVVEKNGLRIGLVALNSTWLQLDDEECKGQLHVDARQLMAVTESAPDEWCSKNDLNLLITHHPADWLHEHSLEYWHSEINPPGRFAAHIFGHVHESSAKIGAEGGSIARIDLQGISTFGLTRIRGKLNRAHGYSTVSFRADEPSCLQIWPRKLYPAIGGGYNINSDNGFKLDLDQSLTIPVNLARKMSDRRSEPETLSEIPHIGSIQESLRELEIQLAAAPAHSNVRTIERKLTMDALRKQRACWLVADWGLGEDEFISTIRSEIDRQAPIYKVDLSEFKNRNQFSEFLKQVSGLTFERMCQLLSEVGSSLLLLDNSMSVRNNSATDTDTEIEIETLVNVVLEYCPAIKVLIRGHRVPSLPKLPVVQISALDAADLRSYVSDHPEGSVISITQPNIDQLHRHTEGIPSRIDQALKELQVVSLSELVSSDVDFAEPNATYLKAPDTLALVIRQLAESSDTEAVREFSLLKVLSLFPQGESLIRIQRFYPQSKFYPGNAANLRAKGLIEVIAYQGLGIGTVDESEKKLKVALPARECIWDLLQKDEPYELNRRAAEIYFGPNWSSGEFKPSRLYRFDSPQCSAGDIINANTIVVRLLKEAIGTDEKRNIDRVLGTATNYVKALARGDHYSSAAALCGDILPLIPSHDFEAQSAHLSAEFACALRMSGDQLRSKSVLESISDHRFPNHKKQSTLLDLALCHQSLGEISEAQVVARQIIEINPHSGYGLHAEAILIELASDDPNRMQKLEALESRSRKQDATVVAGNIALFRARHARDNPDEVRNILAPLIQSKSNADFYNKIRAVVELAEISLKNNEPLADIDRTNLVRAYHFVFNEQMPNLFDRCHAALWRDFSERGDLSNLLVLFRHSSLRWRLRGREDREKLYLGRLRAILGDVITRTLAKVEKEITYYLVRASYYPTREP